MCYLTAMKPKSVQRRILGVDPGTNILGYAVLDTVNDQLHLVQMGVINLSKCKDHQTKLKEIYLQLQEVIECFQPETMAIESPFFGKNVQSMLKLGRAQGVSIAAAITMGLVIEEYSPKMIKQSVTGNGNATKEQVAAMLEHLLSINLEHQKLDASDALATAVCHHFKQNNPIKSGKGNGWSQFIKENPDRLRF